jgi:hypothetical protein
MASGDTLVVFTANASIQTASNYAFADARNNHPVVSYDGTTGSAAMFEAIMPRHYAGGGVTVYLHWSAASATTGDVRWTSAFERLEEAGTDTDADSFAARIASDSTCTATSGAIRVMTLVHTNGAQMDSLAVGEGFRLQVEREAAATSDTMVGNAQLVKVEIKET